MQLQQAQRLRGPKHLRLERLVPQVLLPRERVLRLERVPEQALLLSYRRQRGQRQQ